MKKIKLFLLFLKIGAFTFGGGYAMIAILKNEFVDRHKILKDEEFLDMVSIAESTPGPIAINSATYIGYKIAGFLGALLSTIAVSIPSFVIIYCISLFFDAFMEITFVKYAFTGIQAAVVYLIANAGVKMFMSLQKNAITVSVFMTVMILMILISLFSINFSSIFFILICGFLGIVLNSFKVLEE